MANLHKTSLVFSQMDHTCDIEIAPLNTSSDPYHPGSGVQIIDWASAATSTANTAVKCRLLGVTSTRRFQAEMTSSGQETETGGRAGMPISTHFLLFKDADCPTTLKDLDNTLHPSTTHRIKNVRVRKTGVMVDDGPFDIQHVSKEGYTESLVMLSLLRTP